MTNKEYMIKNEINLDFNSWGYPPAIFPYLHDRYFVWLEEECTEESIAEMNFHKEYGPRSKGEINKEAAAELENLLEEYLNENKI